MEKIASIRAIYIVSTRHVTDLTETCLCDGKLGKKFLFIKILF